ncbi:MAG: hypothetical protein RR313_08295 [Anaerovoracaceae bacterium]
MGYRINVKSLYGKLDIILNKYKVAVFIHGCFWHHHGNCKDATTPKTKTDFRIDKFKKNCDSDNKNRQLLINDGWNVIVLWQCEIEK